MAEFLRRTEKSPAIVSSLHWFWHSWLGGSHSSKIAATESSLIRNSGRQNSDRRFRHLDHGAFCESQFDHTKTDIGWGSISHERLAKFVLASCSPALPEHSLFRR